MWQALKSINALFCVFDSSYQNQKECIYALECLPHRIFRWKSANVNLLAFLESPRTRCSKIQDFFHVLERQFFRVRTNLKSISPQSHEFTHKHNCEKVCWHVWNMSGIWNNLVLAHIPICNFELCEWRWIFCPINYFKKFFKNLFEFELKWRKNLMYVGMKCYYF